MEVNKITFNIEIPVNRNSNSTAILGNNRRGMGMYKKTRLGMIVDPHYDCLLSAPIPTASEIELEILRMALTDGSVMRQG